MTTANCRISVGDAVGEGNRPGAAQHLVSTPGTGSAGSDGVGAAELVDEAVAAVRVAVPPVVFSQPTATPAHRQSRPVMPSTA
jgi:hypothetical protein